MSAGVSVIFLCCDQERYVREAFASVLAQNGPPIEIVATDDASTDGSVAVIEEMTATYRGPHRVIVRRNRARLGLAGNLNAAVRDATGSLLVSAAADDVSHPDRVETLRGIWSSRRVSAVFSEAEMMDPEGRSLGPFAGAGFRPVQSWRAVARGALPVFGCSQAFDRELYDVFGPLPDETWMEDMALGLRALILKGAAYTPSPLVRYRRHDANLSKDGFHARRLDRNAYAQYLSGVLRARAALQRGFARDLATADARSLVAGAGPERTRAEKRARLLDAGADLVTGGRSPAAFVRGLPATLTADLALQAAKCLIVRVAPVVRDWKRGGAGAAHAPNGGLGR